MDFENDGIRLHYELHGPQGGQPIVLVHGFASRYRLNWVGTRWQEALTHAGFRVIGLDCRGHGSSDKPHDPAAYSDAIMAADVWRLLDHLELASADYLGFSMGARIGLRAVLDHPGRFERLVLGGLGTSSALDEAAAIGRALRGGPAEGSVAERFHAFAATRDVNDLEALAACIEGLHGAFEPARLAQIRSPILVVVGERDELVAGADELVELIPTARLVTVPGRDHLGTVPAREFKEAALAFLDDA
jgi:pimeloyl-ACP methyl ester carboxylesterase